MIKVGIIGATGYAGNELVRLLLGHKDAEIVWLGSRSYIDQNYSDVYNCLIIPHIFFLLFDFNERKITFAELRIFSQTHSVFFLRVPYIFYRELPGREPDPLFYHVLLVSSFRLTAVPSQ